MKLFDYLNCNGEPKVIALGYFDGIHIGHNALIDIAKKQANENKLQSCISVFKVDCQSKMYKNKELFDFENRINRIMDTKIESALVIDVCNGFLEQSGQEFLETLIIKHNVKSIIAGADFKFGHNAQCSSSDLQAMCDDIVYSFNLKEKIKVIISNLLEKNNEKVSSTLLKKLITDGNIEYANSLLNKPYSIYGEVLRGRAEGRKMGTPTLNTVFADNAITLKEGVYATKTLLNGVCYNSVSNIGNHPTFNDNNFNCETYLLDCNIDAYNQKVEIFFYNRLRDVIKFATVEELKKQISKDIIIAKDMLSFIN